MTKKPDQTTAPITQRTALDQFLAKARALQGAVAPGGRGRLIFALDATASREPTWDMACQLHGEMFDEVAKIGGLDVQLVFYRGRECKASDWVSDARALTDVMTKVECLTGYTQIGKVLAHARKENSRQRVSALVFVGDAMEEEPAHLYAAARELGVPVFAFQEGDEPAVTTVFREIARLTNGAHCSFTPGAARELAELLRAVAAYATGGRGALLANKSAAAAKLLLQLPPR
jgi:hypothetical protein